MNEDIIRTFANQASEYAEGLELNQGELTPELLKARDLKFAELIVWECYEHCKGQILDKKVADTNELTYNDAVGDCANGLLQHFGVEE